VTTTVKPTIAPASATLPRVLTPETVDERNRDRIGGKAENLWVLTRAGFPVPTWFVVTTEAYREAVGDGPAGAAIRKAIQEADLRGKDAVKAAQRISELARAAVEKAEVPAAARKEIVDEYRRRFARKEGGYELVAVRSSALGEDAAGASFAGQHDTFLFVRGEESLLRAIKRCWASAFTDRALAYRTEKGIDPTQSQVAVVVQRMVFGDASGVMFTVNPENGRRDEILINSVFGIGEGIVSGAYDADSFVVRKGTFWMKTQLAKKPKKIVFHEDKGEGTVEVAVHAGDEERPSLTREEVEKIAEMGERCERHYGRPQDMEFALAKGEIFLLQARPITALPDDTAELTDEGFTPPAAMADAIRRLASGRDTIWDNSNIVESYAGVTTPMTFSFASQAYYYVYLQFCEVIGVPTEEIRRSEQVLRNMIGLVKGRVYYNLRNWYRLIAFLPGYEYNRDFMATMMGLKETADTGDRKEFGRFEKYAVELPKMLFRGSKLGLNFYQIDAWVAEFFETFNRTYKRWRDKDFDTMSIDQLVEAYRSLEADLLWAWKAPIINDFAAMIYYGVLRRLIARWVEPDPKSCLENDLLCGEGGIESTEPSRRMMLAAMEARRSAALSKLLAETADERCMEAVARGAANDPDVKKFHEYVLEHLKLFGDRCMGELKLETATLADEPRILFSFIKNYMKQPDLDPIAMEKREKEIRAKAEATVKARLKWKPVRAATLRHVIENTRKAVKNRENMRFSRTRIFGIVRRIVRAVGKQLAAAKLLDDPNDAFYLEIQEMLSLSEGRLTCWDLRALTALRKAQFERWRREPVDERFTTRGVYIAGQTYRNETAAPADADPNLLRGMGACPGRIKNKVRVILSPEGDLNLDKEILVCEKTDPGWVPLFPSACALLVERGSMLSHSAIVAREMGIPCVVGVRDLLKKVKDGDVVEMDGGAGTIRLDVDPEGAGPQKIA
jgi:pyruvate,water dikinase